MRRLLHFTLILLLLSIGEPERVISAQGVSASELIDDTNFEQGFIVWAPVPGKKRRSGELLPFDNGDAPVWRIAQWHSRFDLALASRKIISPGVIQFADGAKSVTLDHGRPDERIITLSLSGTTEYNGKSPERGEAWPHLLLERPLLAQPALTDLAIVPFRISFRLIQQEANRLAGWSKQRHTAQFLLYITIQNQNRQSAGFGDYLWFGVSMYDARYRHTPPHKSADFGTEHKQGTGKFIFNPAGKRYFPASAHDGQWITIRQDLLPLMKEALEQAWQQGFLADSHDSRDYHLNGINLGWEVTGTWDVAMQVKDLYLGAVNCRDSVPAAQTETQLLVLQAADPGTSRDAGFTAHPESKFANKTPAEIEAFERGIAANLKTLPKRAICDLALVPPILNTNPLPEFDYGQLDYAMTIGIARTPEGRIWACWVAGEDGPGGFFVLNRSEPDGETFSKPMLVINMHKKGLPPRSTLVGNLWTDPSGKLWLFFNQTIGHNDGRDGVWIATCENPDATKPSWSKPRRISHGFVITNPTILNNGEWVQPVEFIGNDTFPELRKYSGVNLLISKDQGENWQWRSSVPFEKSTWVEPMVVERTDGRLWLLARTHNNVRQRFSSDRGRTWTAESDPAFKHPRARFFIERLKSGKLLLVKHGTTIDACSGRKELTAWLSSDEGETWQGGMMLDERATISYPDGGQAADGIIRISYDRNRSTDGEILMARFTEEDVLAKKLVSANAKLRILISRATQK